LIKFSFLIINIFSSLYNGLGVSKCEYASVIWNSIALIDSSEPEIIQRELTPVCYTIFLLTCENKSVNILIMLNLSTLQSC
jgi:hypothetical protein